MNPSPLRTVLSVASLASLSVAILPAMEIEQAIADDFFIGADLQSKQYDQGIVRNDDAVLHERLGARYWDIGLTLDAWQVLGEDLALPRTTTRGNVPQRASNGETTQFNARLDYLIELKNYFQLLPFVEWVAYPNIPDVPLKDDQWYIGLDGWYMTPLTGVELGGSISYDPFYDVKANVHGAGGWSSNHLLRGSFGAREFYQRAPIDLTFWQMFNFGNENYNRMVNGGDNADPGYLSDNNDTGFNLLDIGAQAFIPLPWKEWWLTMKLEGHFWLENDERERMADAGKDTKEWIVAVGVRWWPTAENAKN